MLNTQYIKVGNIQFLLQMNSDQIIEQALSLIEQGKYNLANYVRKENEIFSSKEYFMTQEYLMIYSEAIKFLHKHGYIDSVNLEIQEAYFKLIPEPKEYTKEANNFNDLFSENNNIRIKAANYFSWQARQETNSLSSLLFTFPKTHEKLLPALKDEDPKVVKAIAAAIGCSYWRYFNDQRIIPEMLNLLYSKNKDILLAGIGSTVHINVPQKWDQLIYLLQQKLPQKIIYSLCQHFRSDIKSELKITIQPLLLVCLKQKINLETKYAILAALIRTFTDESIQNFKKLIDLKKDKDFSKILKQEIEMNCLEERITYLNKALFI